MIIFLFRRLLSIAPTLLGISLLTFLLMHAIPGSPWDTGGPRGLANSGNDAITRSLMDKRYHLDQPVLKQYFSYMFAYQAEDGSLVCGAVCGNLGPSFRQLGRNVDDILFDPPPGKPAWDSRVGYSLRLAGLALLFSIVIGIPLGLLAALRQGTWVDRAVNLFLLAGLSFPAFLVGLIAIIIFASNLHWIPVLPREWSDPRLWILPAVVLSLPTMAAAARLTRSAVLQVTGQDYIRTAYAKGASHPRVVWKHLFRTALVPIVTFLGPALGELIVTSVIVETMFSFPGFGREFWEAVDRLDYTMIMAVTLIYAVLIASANLGVDVLHGFLDPRIRGQRGSL